MNERITAQHSLFLFGLPDSEKLRSKEITIESASKEQILKELEGLHDICEESLFLDFVGFAYIQRSDAPYLTPNAEKYFHSGVKARQQGQYSEAIQDFTKVIELNPDDAEAYYFRGFTYYSKGGYDHAIEDFTKVIELNPDDAEAYYFRGFTYYSKGGYDHAIEDFTKAIELNPDYAEAYLVRRAAYDSQGEYDHAIKDFHATAHYTRGLARLHLKHWQEAKSDLTSAKNIGLDIATFSREDIEQNFEVKLPEDIAAMLTKSEN